MRVMILIRATEESEAGLLPSGEALEAMANFNDELAAAGVLIEGEALKPTSQAKLIDLDDVQRTVSDGPFDEANGLIGGYWLWEVRDVDHAVALVKRFPNSIPGYRKIEIRPVYELIDYGRTQTMGMGPA